MSFDIFVQRFFDQQPVAIARDDFDAIFGAFVVERDGAHEFVHLAWDDEEADVYGVGDGDSYEALMFSDFTERIYPMLFELAVRSGAVVMPEGGVALVADASLLPGLPDEVREDALVIADAEALASAVAGR
jgi:hypothetical protein